MIFSLVQSAENMPTTYEWLNSAERGQAGAFKIEKRQRDWLLGRWTAKQVIASVVGPIALHEIEIANRATGEPFVKCIGESAGQLSISHSHGHAFCAFLPDANAVLGADIELIETRQPVFVADYFTIEEQKRVAAASAAMQSTLVTAIWSAKEAALKALHKGLSVDTRSVSCLIAVNASDSAEWQSFTIEIDPKRLPDSPNLTGSWCVSNQFVLTVASSLDKKEHHNSLRLNAFA
ncbi:MAG: 4'-phosphopantetheinyl transferase superfamily protein [Anaerolineae bacterium]|nr:4'-phosphopantetheinyl transferase superfamily protein [Anaerolineae bacterium]